MIASKLLDKAPELINIALHFIFAGETKSQLSEIQKAVKLAKEGKYEEAAKLLIQPEGKGFEDENLHKRSARKLTGEMRERYVSYLDRLWREEPRVHSYYILAVATETKEEERDRTVREFASCRSYSEFRRLINAYGFNQPQTPQQKALIQLWDAITMGVKKAAPNIRQTAKAAGEGIKNVAQATDDAFTQINSEIADGGIVERAIALKEKMKRKYYKNKERR